MDDVKVLLLAVALAMDAFSVSVTSGIALRKVRVQDAALVGAFFGGFQFLMPCIGWFLGCTVSSYIEQFDHWIAFILLAFIGGKMVYEAIKEGEEEEVKNPLQLKVLTLLAIATSIDSLAAGVTFVTMQVPLLFAATVIGIVAFLFSFCGLYIGNKCGDLFGNKAEIIGGLVLIGLGIAMLF